MEDYKNQEKDQKEKYKYLKELKNEINVKKVVRVCIAIVAVILVVLAALSMSTRKPVAIEKRIVLGDSDTSILIVYYDYDEDLGDIAEKLQEKTGGDVLRIDATNAYGHSIFSTMRYKLERKMKKNPELDVELPNFLQYDTIFVAGPVWEGTVSNPIQTFMKEADLSGSKVAAFWTYDGDTSRYEADFEEMAIDAEVIKGLDLSDVSEAELDAALEEWIKTVIS